jgi:hypothetical protein
MQAPRVTHYLSRRFMTTWPSSSSDLGRAATSRCFVPRARHRRHPVVFIPLLRTWAKSEVFPIIVTDYLVRCGISYFFFLFS